MTYRYLIFFLQLIPFSLLGQFEGNFEFLDHRERLSVKGAHVAFSDNLYYVSHNENRDMTVVNRLNENREIETIFSSYFTSKSRTSQTSDSTYSIYLYQLFDYDIGAPGFYAIHIGPDDYKIDSILTWESPHFEDYHYIYDLSQTSDSSYVAISDEGLLNIVNGSIATITKDISDWSYSIRRNSKNSVFTFKDTVLFSLINGTLTPTLTTSLPILDIKFESQNAYILTTGNLHVYSQDLQTLENTFDLPESINSFDQLLVKNDLVYYVSENLNGSVLSSVNASGDITFLYEFVDESIKGVVSTKDGAFMINGEYQIDNISYNVYFRSIDLNESHTYETIDLEIETFKLYEGTIDTLNQYVDYNGDTTYTQQYNYLVEFIIRNNTNETIFNYDIFSGRYLNAFGFTGGYFDYHSSVPIEAGDTAHVITSYTRILIPTDGFNVVLPGANYKFNTSETRIIFPEFIVDVNELNTIQPLGLYPNPSSDFIQLDLDDPLASVAIYNMNGQLSYFQNTNGLERIDIQHLNSGTYVLVGIDKTGQRFVGRFVKF